MEKYALPVCAFFVKQFGVQQSFRGFRWQRKHKQRHRDMCVALVTKRRDALIF